MIAGWSARSWTARSGSHLRLMRGGSAARWAIAKILPRTLNTLASAENGYVSSAPVKPMHSARRSMSDMLAARCA